MINYERIKGMKDKILDYNLALVNLYGMVEVVKILELYNLHQVQELDEDKFKKILDDHKPFLRDHYIEVTEGFLISADLKVLSHIEKELEEKTNKPYYMPSGQELLKYRNRTYCEVNHAYKDLASFIEGKTSSIKDAQRLVRGISHRCKSLLYSDNIIAYLQENNLIFEDPKDKSVFMNMLEALEGQTRKWSNNGYTHKELKARAL